MVRLMALSKAVFVADADAYPTSSAMRCHVQPCARSSMTFCSRRRVSTFPARLGLPLGILLVAMFSSLAYVSDLLCGATLVLRLLHLGA